MHYMHLEHSVCMCVQAGVKGGRDAGVCGSGGVQWAGGQGSRHLFPGCVQVIQHMLLVVWPPALVLELCTTL